MTRLITWPVGGSTAGTPISDTDDGLGDPTATPPVPASGVSITSGPLDSMVETFGGSGLAIQVAGQPVAVGGAFYVPANVRVKLTYTTAPTWVWRTL